MNRIKKIKSLSSSQVARKLSRVKKTFINIPIVKGINGYPYSLFTLTDFVPAMDPGLIEDMADLLVYHGDFSQADILVSEADRGAGPLLQAVAVRVNLPYTLANWYPKQIKGEVCIKMNTGWGGQGAIYLNSLKRGQKAIIIDDLLSTGGTALALIEAVTKADAKVLSALFVGEKRGKDHRGKSFAAREKIKARYDIPIKTLVQFKAEGQTTQPVKKKY